MSKLRASYEVVALRGVYYPAKLRGACSRAGAAASGIAVIFQYQSLASPNFVNTKQDLVIYS